jgi:hypothetical protein
MTHIKIHQDHWCSSQSHAFNIVTVQIDRSSGHAYYAKSVVEFLAAEDCSLIEIHRCLRSVYVRMPQMLTQLAAGSIIGENDIDDRACGCGPATAATSETVKKSCW